MNGRCVWRTFIVAGFVVHVLACAKTGDPEPPRVRVPQVSSSLTAEQKGTTILLSVPLPKQNADGSELTNLALVEVFRVIERDRQSDAAIKEEEFLRRGQRIFARTIQPDESQDSGGASLAFQDDLAFEDPGAVYDYGFRYAVRFVNTKNQTAGFGNQVFTAPLAIPNPPAELTFEAAQDQVTLQWKPQPVNRDGTRPARVAGYNVYRKESGESFPSKPANSSLVREPVFDDTSFEFEKVYHYAVTVLASENPRIESELSAPLAVHTKDVFPPSPPPHFELVYQDGILVLFWTAPPEGDVLGFHLYRRETSSDRSDRLRGRDPIETLSYRDPDILTGRQYEYRVTAIDSYGNESDPHIQVIRIP